MVTTDCTTYKEMGTHFHCSKVDESLKPVTVKPQYRDIRVGCKNYKKKKRKGKAKPKFKGSSRLKISGLDILEEGLDERWHAPTGAP